MERGISGNRTSDPKLSQTSPVPKAPKLPQPPEPSPTWFHHVDEKKNRKEKEVGEQSVLLGEGRFTIIVDCMFVYGLNVNLFKFLFNLSKKKTKIHH